jgi:hypothetical protein
LSCPKPFEVQAIKAIGEIVGEEIPVVGGTPGAAAYHLGDAFVIANDTPFIITYRPPTEGEEESGSDLSLVSILGDSC